MGKPLGRLVDGRLDLSGQNLTDESLAKIPILDDLTDLILSNNQITSFSYLRPQPKLKTLIAANNPIDYLDGLSQQPALFSLDLANTNLAERPDFREGTIATVGIGLKVLNGVKVTEKERAAGDEIAAKGIAGLFLVPPEEVVDPKILAVWLKAHQHQFNAFAYNQAVAIDLATNGPLPIVDGAGTEEDLVRAIDALKERNEKLKEIIGQKSEELGIDPPIF
jgi:hypothetical protein